MGHEIARNWRLRQQRYRLVGEKCPNGHFVFPPRDICPDCSDEAKEPYELSGKGEVYSSTIVYQAPAGFEEFVPYEEALVKLDEGPMITAQITDKDNPTVPTPIGTRVEHVTRKYSEDGETGLIKYGYKFRVPITSS